MSLPRHPDAQNRYYHLDVLRVIACFCVILIHASSSFVVQDFGSLDFWIGNLFDGVSRIGIPLFIMISGALLLDENYPYSGQKIKKHIKKMILVFVFWSVLYCLWYEIIQPLRHAEAISFRRVVKALIVGPYHFWFIYLIIGLYLIVPLLRLWVKKENKRYVQYFLILSSIFCFLIPQIINIGKNYNNLFEAAGECIGYLNLDYLTGYTMFYVLGWYLNTFEIRHKKLLYFSGAISLIVTIFGTYILAITTGNAALMYKNLHITIVLQAAAVFVFIKEKYADKQKNSRLISMVSGYSLGIYIMHIFIMENLLPVLHHFNINSAILKIPALFILTLLISLPITALFSRIPFLRRFV